MPRVVEFAPTPNPNALKCVLDAPLEPLPADGVRSYRNAAAATNDPIALRLFAIPGVTNVLIAGDWVTVGKSADAPWKSLKPAITQALA